MMSVCRIKIAMGDARFLEKAEGRMDRFVGRTSILVIASHNQNLIKRVCNRIVELEGENVKRAEFTEAFFGAEKEKV